MPGWERADLHPHALFDGLAATGANSTSLFFALLTSQANWCQRVNVSRCVPVNDFQQLRTALQQALKKPKQKNPSNQVSVSPPCMFLGANEHICSLSAGCK